MGDSSAATPPAYARPGEASCIDCGALIPAQVPAVGMEPLRCVRCENERDRLIARPVARAR